MALEILVCSPVDFVDFLFIFFLWQFETEFPQNFRTLHFPFLEWGRSWNEIVLLVLRLLPIHIP
jgi:hypothetical protein